jgi:hypothetical protein
VDINALASGSGSYPMTDTLTPFYLGGIFSPDGTDNAGSMFEEEDSVAGNTIKWETGKTTQQDYDIVIRYDLPEKFQSFAATDPISLLYKTQGTPAEARIDFTLQKEGAPGGDVLSGAGLSLSSINWNESFFSLADPSIFSAGDRLVLKLKMHATAGNSAFVSDIKIRYNSD